MNYLPFQSTIGDILPETNRTESGMSDNKFEHSFKNITSGILFERKSEMNNFLILNTAYSFIDWRSHDQYYTKDVLYYEQIVKEKGHLISGNLGYRIGKKWFIHFDLGYNHFFIKNRNKGLPKFGIAFGKS